MKVAAMQDNEFDAAEWEKRKRNNKRLGYLMAVIVLAIFLGSIWKYRPF
jgi:SNF family Na+-dependent transporter